MGRTIKVSYSLTNDTETELHGCADDWSAGVWWGPAGIRATFVQGAFQCEAWGKFDLGPHASRTWSSDVHVLNVGIGDGRFVGVVRSTGDSWSGEVRSPAVPVVFRDPHDAKDKAYGDVGAGGDVARSAAPEAMTIGIIDFYGRQRVGEAEARAALAFKEGDTFSPDGPPPETFRATAERLKQLPDVLHVSMTPICCDAGRLIVYVGLEERDAPALHLRSAPKGKERLPADVLAAAARFGKAFTEAVKRGDNGEDRSQGHSLMHDPATRAIQEEFPGFARRDLATLRRVLKNSSEADHRAVAAQILGYAHDKQAVVGDLVRAMSDPEEAVRNNAMRALLVFADTVPGPGRAVPRVPADPFIEFLHSPEWTDRNKASGALEALTRGRDAGMLATLRKTALVPLSEMAEWKSSGHALPAYLILARIAGKSDADAMQAWDRGDRRAVIDAVTVRPERSG
ncbi:MAG TPA: HEAT repeat domain-containing protein [Verrucomicrobiae bacterium]|nr:HEAT repeat domain-containing protein [Verrucomicrobiae bacterium]